MKRLATVLALLTAAASPALAGGDWYEDDYYDGGYYEQRHWRGDYRTAYGYPYRAPAYEVYIPYGTYFADDPHAYGEDCKIERKWKRGHYREKIECDDD
jgi:hypothetical protein